ncbi:MAG: hypothetical protein JO097_01705, partial [Acidobacteriaceae bacterium]|nr:hypothetical protein [Acidobacteriaceae bacterium]
MRRLAILLGLLVADWDCGFALNPQLDLTQYAHTAWTAREGLNGSTRCIVQTRDGYIWLGTEFGLARFDGVRFVPWVAPRQHLPSNNIRSLLAARDGTLWIGTVEGLASWRDGKVKRYAEVAGQNVLTLLEDGDGTVWAGTFGTPNGKLCAVQRSGVKCYGSDGSLGQWVYTVYQEHGQLWVHSGSGVWRWKPGPPKRFPVRLPGSFESSQTLVQGDNGAGLIAIADGRIRQIINERVSDYPLSTGDWQFTALNLLRDRDGVLWIGTLGRGLLRVHHGKTSVFAQSDGLSGNRILSLFEDREGNIWAGTADGLDCFREFAVPSISVKQGLSRTSIMTVLAARDNTVWLSALDGLNRWNNGHITIYHAPSDARTEGSRVRARARDAPAPDGGLPQQTVAEITDPELPDNEAGSLFEDDHGRIWVSTPAGITRFEHGRFHRLRDLPGGWVNTMIGDGHGGLWISYQDYGVTRVVNEKVTERIPWSKLGGHVVASALRADPTRGGLWLGFFQGGLVYFKDGQVRASYGKSEGLGSGRVMRLLFDHDGTLWAATEGGLSRLRNGRITTLASSNGLPCDTVHWAIEDDRSSVWLYTACGLLRMPRTDLDAWASDPTHKVKFTLFDSSDGVRSRALLPGYTPRVSKSPDGKVWFATIESVSVIDPQNLPRNRLPPPVHIEQITVDGKAYEAARELRLPARVRNLAIQYTALSFVAPEKVHFKYKLEGQDQGWREVINDRQVQYSNLPPRSYRFRVIACNNSGVWNETGDALDFSIEPAYYQTTWFRTLCAFFFLSLLWIAYQFRVGHLRRELNMASEARLNERMRIGRELHDSLLQTVQGLMLSLQAVSETMPLGAAKSKFEKTLEIGDRAIREARQAVRDLRSASTT